MECGGFKVFLKTHSDIEVSAEIGPSQIGQGQAIRIGGSCPISFTQKSHIPNSCRGSVGKTPLPLKVRCETAKILTGPEAGQLLSSSLIKELSEGEKCGR
jgi:hypothetical protein